MASGGDIIDKLYKNYEILTDAVTNNKISEHETEYREILDAVKGSDKDKRLAAQFIAKFFKYFPSLGETAIDRQLDLCEDDDVQIRRQAIKELPQFCKDSKEHTPRIGDILAQLLTTEEATELQQVHLSLQTLARFDTVGTLTGIFSQIISGDETIRFRNFQFLSNKFIKFSKDIITPEVEDFFIGEIQKILQDVTDEEFHVCMVILSQTKLGTTLAGQSELVKLAVEQADMETDLGAIGADDETVERFIQCANEAMAYFSTQAPSTPFVKFMCEKLLPLDVWSLIAATEESANQTKLRLLKVFAELCTHTGQVDTPAAKVDAIFNVLVEYMPLPPADADLNESPSFEFSHAECLMYALHTIGKQCPDHLAFREDAAKLKDFRSRLQYLARGTQGYIKKLQGTIKGKTPEELKSDDNQIIVTALKTTSNISLLIRDLFHSPPSYKTTIQLSWVQPKAAAKRMVDNTVKTATKRHAPITFDDESKNGSDAKSAKQLKTNSANGNGGKVYTPPSGKYSGKVQNYSSNGSGGNSNKFGGGYNRSRNGRNNSFRSNNRSGGGGGNKNRRY